MPPGGIQTHDLSRRAAADLRLRPRGYWDRQVLCITINNILLEGQKQEICKDTVNSSKGLKFELKQT